MHKRIAFLGGLPKYSPLYTLTLGMKQIAAYSHQMSHYWALLALNSIGHRKLGLEWNSGDHLIQSPDQCLKNLQG